MATANLHINGFYAKCSKVTGRHPPEYYLVGSKGHESAKNILCGRECTVPLPAGRTIRTVQTTAEGTPFSGSMNTMALCDFDMRRLRRTLTYLRFVVGLLYDLRVVKLVVGKIHSKST